MRQILLTCKYLVCLLTLQSLYAQGEPTPYIKLIEACRIGNLANVQAQLNAGVSIDQADGQGMTPLMHAIDAGQPAVAYFLIEAGADLVTPRSEHYDTLGFAIRAGDVKLVSTLLSQGAPLYNDDNLVDSEEGAIIWADTQMLELLADHGADYDRWRSKYHTALSLAAKYENPPVVQYLLANGHDPNERNPTRNYPLALAAMEGNEEIVAMLLAAGAEPNAINQGSMNIFGYSPRPHTALLAAVLDNNLVNVEQLLDAGANPKLLENQAILYADLAGNQAIYDTLLAHGAEEPEPYAFLTLAKQDERWVKEPDDYARRPPVDWLGMAYLNAESTAKGQIDTTAEITVAIVPASEDMMAAETLLTVELSNFENIRLVERAQLQEIFNEWTLARDGYMAAEESVRIGHLLGADCLVVLWVEDKQPLAKIVSSSTGLVLQLIAANKGQDIEEWSESVSQAVRQQAGILKSGVEGTTLVSIPQITALNLQARDVDEERSLSHALSMHLGALDDVYVLDRREMLRLAQEKTLTQDTAQFYASGWLIDGSYDRIKDGQLDMTLRLRQGAGGQEIVITESGSMSQPQELLARLTAQISQALGATESLPRSLAQEAEAYAQEAENAYLMNQWTSAQQAADAAWVLGNRSDDVLDIRVRSRLQRLRITQDIIREKLDDLNGANAMVASRAPLLLDRVDARELTSDQYMELTYDLLAVYEPVIAKKAGHTPFELDLLAYYPEAAKGMNLPLSLLSTISDQRTHQKELKDIRQRLLSATQGAMDLAKANHLPDLYQRLFDAYLMHLAYWMPNEESFLAEVDARLAEATAMNWPYSKHTVYRSLAGYLPATMNKVGGQADTAWQRAMKMMLRSDNPDARLLGLILLRKDTNAIGRSLWATRQVSPLLMEIVRTDSSLLGATDYYRTKWDVTPTIKGEFRVYPEYGIGAWYPRMPMGVGDDRLKIGADRMVWQPTGSEQLRTLDTQLANFEIIKANRETVARLGSSAFISINNSRSLQGIPDDELAYFLELVDQGYAKIQERTKGQPEWDNTVYRYNSYEVKPARDLVFKERDRVAAMTAERPVVKLGKFYTPIFSPDCPIPTEQRARESFGCSGAVAPADQNGSWMYRDDIGFFYDSPSEDIHEAYFLPYDSLLRNDVNYFGKRYVAAWFRKLNGEETISIGVLDRQDKSWKFYTPERLSLKPFRSSNLGVTELVISGEELYYVFVDHPEPDEVGTVDIHTDSRTAMGIGCINLASGKETLLVSNRRSPKESPLDGFNARLGINLLPDGELYINHRIYTPSTGQWRNNNTERALRMHHATNIFAKPRNDRYSVYAANSFRGSEMPVKLHSVVDGKKLNISEANLTLDLSESQDFEPPAEWSYMRRTHRENKDNPNTGLVATDDGIVIYNNVGYYFLDKETLFNALDPLVELIDE